MSVEVLQSAEGLQVVPARLVRVSGTGRRRLSTQYQSSNSDERSSVIMLDFGGTTHDAHIGLDRLQSVEGRPERGKIVTARFSRTRPRK